MHFAVLERLETVMSTEVHSAMIKLSVNLIRIDSDVTITSPPNFHLP